MLGRPHLFLTSLCLAALGGEVRAEASHDAQLWSNTTVFGSLGDLAFFAEVQPRFGNGISQLNQLILRPAIGWKVNDALTLYQGYARVYDTSVRDNTTTEDRSFQEINWKIGTFSDVKVSSRTRFEERWQSAGQDLGFRLRENLRFAIPLTENQNGIAAVGWTEVFVALNDTDWGARAGFDRLRTFAGLELPIGGKSTVEVGYLNQTTSATKVDHIVSLNLFLRY